MPQNTAISITGAVVDGNDIRTAFARARCSLISSSIAASLSIFIFNVVVILVSCQIVHVFLRRLGQHRIISDFVVGLLIRNIRVLSTTMEEYVIVSFVHIGSIAFSLYLFVLGLEMDPKIILRWSGPTNKIAYAGVISTVGITILSYTLIKHTVPQIDMNHPYHVIFAIAIALSATSSHILTRLITELKMQKSEIGRLAIRTGLTNDMLCTSLMCAAVSLYPSPPESPRTAARGLLNFLLIVFEAYIIIKFINPVIIRKLNDRNPEGKPIRSVDTVAICIISVVLCSLSFAYTLKPSFNCFIVGLFLQREGRMSNFLIVRINYVLTTFLLPIYLVLVGLSSDYKSWIQLHIEIRTIVKMIVVWSIGTVGRLTGTMAYGIRNGIQCPEAVGLGLLLNVKGYFQIFCAQKAAMAQIIDGDTMMAMVLVVVGTVIPTPLVVRFLVRRAKAREWRKPMGLQWCDSGEDVRILVGLHSPEDLQMAVNVMEAMRGDGEGASGGLVANVVDMVEMTDKAAASLMHGEGMDSVTVTDEEVVEMRKQIGSALQSFREESGDGVRIRRMLAVSSFDNMHDDICNGAQESMAVLVVLPFHRRQRVDGAMSPGHPGHRLLNQKVLQASPCSVALLLSRGPARPLSPPYNVCAVFLGGPDDREVLAYAARISHHPAVNLTVLRFHAAASAKATPSRRGRRVLTDLGKLEAEQRADDECFAAFCARFVGGGRRVGCVERRVQSGGEVVGVLRELEASYQLFVVGVGIDRQSVLTAGMTEWAECPEVGPIGDVLAASDFSVSASVAVVQQHNIGNRHNGIDEDFLSL